MTETECHIWLQNMRECLREEREEMPPFVASTFNEVFRLLEEALCPRITHLARMRLERWQCPECGSLGYEHSHVCGDGS